MIDVSHAGRDTEVGETDMDRAQGLVAGGVGVDDGAAERLGPSRRGSLVSTRRCRSLGAVIR